MTADNDLETRLVTAALELADEDGWNRFSLADVAKRAGASLTEAYALFPTKAHVLCRIFAHHDRAVLAGGVADDAAPRDRLFDIMMRRFDALQAHREGVVRILREAPLDPISAVAALPAFGQAMAWMLEAAGISANGPAGGLRIKGLGLVYANVLRTWLTDDSADLARTMAALDRDLRRAETVAQRLAPIMGGDHSRASTRGDSLEDAPPYAEGGDTPPNPA